MQKFYSEILRFLDELTKSYGEPVADAQQWDPAVLTALKQLLPRNAFVTITNLKPSQVYGHEPKKVVVGIKSALGYDEASYTLEKSLDIVHPIFRIMIEEYAMVMYILTGEESFKKKRTADTTYTKQYVAQHADRFFVKVEVTSKIGAVDAQGNILSHYNFGLVHEDISKPIVLKPIISHPLSGYFGREEQELRDKAMPKILKRIKRNPKYGKHFLTKKEFEVAKYHYEGLGSSEIAKLMKIGINGVKQHNKNILRKTRLLFPIKFVFKGANDASKYLEILGFLDYEDCFLK